MTSRAGPGFWDLLRHAPGALLPRSWPAPAIYQRKHGISDLARHPSMRGSHDLGPARVRAGGPLARAGILPRAGAVRVLSVKNPHARRLAGVLLGPGCCL